MMEKEVGKGKERIRVLCSCEFCERKEGSNKERKEEGSNMEGGK